MTEEQILGDYHRPRESYDLQQFIIVGLGNKAMSEETAAQRLLSTLLTNENLLNRDFHADRPNQKWVTDISYIHTKQGALYLSIIRD